MAEEFRIEKAAGSTGAVVLRLFGRLDAKAAQALVAQCTELRQREIKVVVLNLAKISFVASSGIGSLLALTEDFQEIGGSIRLAQISDSVRSVVDLLNLGDYLRIDATEEAGLAAARS